MTRASSIYYFRLENKTFHFSFFRTEINITLDWLVTLSLARYIRDMGPNGRKSSCRSDSLVSSDKLVTRIVAVSSVKYNTRFHCHFDFHIFILQLVFLGLCLACHNREVKIARVRVTLFCLWNLYQRLFIYS